MKRLLLIFLLICAPLAAEVTFDFEKPDIEPLNAYFAEYEERMKSEFFAQYAEAKAMGPMTNPWMFEAEAKKTTYNAKLIVIDVTGYDYRGGAHGMPIRDVLVFDAETYESLTQDQWLVEGVYDELSRFTREGMIAQDFEADDWMLKGTAPEATNFPVVIPRLEGLEVVIPPYQAGPYSMGTPSVTIPWSKANRLIKPDYRI